MRQRRPEPPVGLDAAGRAVVGYGERGAFEAALASQFVAEAAWDLATKVLGRPAEWGVELERLAETFPFVEACRAPAAVEAFARALTASPSRSRPPSCAVNTHGPSSISANVCSVWAATLESLVTTVQPSLNSRVACEPNEIIGSIANTVPATSGIPRPGLP